MDVNRRTLLGAAAAGLCSAPGLQALAQSDWPSRPVRLISPYGAGGANDISARILAEHLKGTLGQSFIVENKAGAGTRIANELAARAAPDGYTVLYAAAPYATAEALYGKLPFDPRKDLKPVAMAALAPLFLIVNSQSAFKTVKEFIAYGKARTDGLTFASPGAGSQPHLAAQLLMRDAGVKGLNVHVRGDAVAYTELLAGRVDATFTAITTALPHIEAGKLRVLGVASPARSGIYPQAPTMREQGFTNVVASGWYGFMVPSATPTSITARLQAAVNRALSDPAVKAKLLAQGLDANGTTASEFGKFIEDETRKWTDVIRKAGIKGE
jgi:tripartite-type tricarboxylate transporter receptor subunit TctC